ncbi:MAG: DUF3224 domain-containing protein [Thermocrispum sp.]
MTTYTFTMQTWDERVVSGDDSGPRVAYAHSTFEYSGLIEGSSVADTLLFYVGEGHDGGGVTSSGLERFDGSVGGRKGTFIVRHEYSFTADGDTHHVTSTFTVLPGSGTGELTGLAGDGTISGSSQTMDYTFEPSFP